MLPLTVRQFDAGTKGITQARFVCTPVQMRQVGGRESFADFRGNQPPGGRAGHAQAQVSERDDVFQALVTGDGIARVDGARRHRPAETLTVGKHRLAGQVLAEEESREPLRQTVQAGRVIMLALQRAAIGERTGLAFITEQAGHVVIDGAGCGFGR